MTGEPGDTDGVSAPGGPPPPAGPAGYPGSPVPPEPPVPPAYRPGVPPAYQQGVPPAYQQGVPPAYQPGVHPAYQQGGYPAPYPSGYVYPGRPAEPVSASTVVLAVLSGLVTLTCYGFVVGVGPLVLAIIAWTRSATDPAGARRLTRIGWIVLGSLFAVAAVLVAVLVAVAVRTDGGTPATT